MSYAAQTIAAAANIEHEWDARALDWLLDRNSVVVEVGGYIGRWALQIQERYHPHLYVFEPQDWACATCRKVLDDRAVVLNFGLGVEDAQHSMEGWGTDGCSFVKPSGSGPVKFGLLQEIGSVFNRFDIDHIDLMLINIEGYEYTLIPHMLARGILPDRLMVQFHPADAGDETPMIYEQLAAHGYRPLWSYGVVLSAWERL